MKKTVLLLLIVLTGSLFADTSGENYTLVSDTKREITVTGSRPFTGDANLGGHFFLNTGHGKGEVLFANSVGDIISDANLYWDDVNSVLVGVDHGGLTGLDDANDHTWALLIDATRDLINDWVISANSITLTAGTLTAEQITSTDDMNVTNDLLVGGHAAFGSDATIHEHWPFRIMDTYTGTTTIYFGQDLAIIHNPSANRTISGGLNFSHTWKPSGSYRITNMFGNRGLIIVKSVDASADNPYATTASCMYSGFAVAPGATATGAPYITQANHFSTGAVTVTAPAYITTLCGYYDAGQTAGVTNWGFYGLSANNYLSGNLYLGQTDGTIKIWSGADGYLDLAADVGIRLAGHATATGIIKSTHSYTSGLADAAFYARSASPRISLLDTDSGTGWSISTDDSGNFGFSTDTEAGAPSTKAYFNNSGDLLMYGDGDLVMYSGVITVEPAGDLNLQGGGLVGGPQKGADVHITAGPAVTAGPGQDGGSITLTPTVAAGGTDGSVKIGDGGTTDYTNIALNGTTSFVGAAELIIPSSTTLPGTANVGSLYLDTDAGANGTVYMYANGAWRVLVALP